MDILQVAAKISALCKGLVTLRAAERTQARMFAEMIAQVAAFLEGAVTSFIATLEEKLDAMCVRILHPDCLVPFVRDSFECLRIDILLRMFDPVRIQLIKIAGVLRHCLLHFFEVFSSAWR